MKRTFWRFLSVGLVWSTFGKEFCHDPIRDFAGRPMRSALGLIAVGAFVIWLTLDMPGFQSRGFSDADIETTKASIKSEFEKKPDVKVTDVFLMRKSDTELTGFAKLRLDKLDLDLTKACTVTRDSSGDGRYMWSCQ